MRHITHYLNPKLTDIYLHTTRIEEIHRHIVHFLPEHLKDHFSVGSFRNGCLILVTTDAVWASQLRFMLPELRDKLRMDAKFHQLASIKINIDSIQSKPAAKAIKSKPVLPSPWQTILKLLSK